MTMDGIHGASYSEKYFDGDTCDAAYNKNVEYLQHTYFWWLYLGAIPFVVMLLRLTVMEDRPLAEALTVTHVIHNVLFFYIFHWVKGSPDNYSQGEFNGLTLWEQIDNGIPWTKTKKVFFLVPTALIFAASYVSDYDFKYLSYNAPVYVLLGILPKIPEMHRVRLFGINSTIGIDDDEPAAAPAAAGGSGRVGAGASGSKKQR